MEMPCRSQGETLGPGLFPPRSLLVRTSRLGRRRRVEWLALGGRLCVVIVQNQAFDVR